MAYSEFDLDTVTKSFNLTIEHEKLFEKIKQTGVSSWLEESLEKGLKLSLGSEKARAEFIVAPVLLASRELSHDSFYLYSGQNLDIDPERGLKGNCDFILTNSPPSPTMQSPIAVITEAKKNDIEGTLGECIAQMLGVRLYRRIISLFLYRAAWMLGTKYSEKQGTRELRTIFGCVTTGETWQFLKLRGKTVWIDSDRYYINKVDKILGVLQAIVSYYKE
ncbi:hypothetical protein [Desulfonema magnum]|uniref:Uncharacterized protein n=1 Tax=Desulfonema magnum TaxID=45655 RepID=A0A975BVD8_9BACT|nr:hypothetical protein [Desulfonema magnum]QTA92461.1 Uncharacterized protein dnm_085410 [Desulfonema magnum]